MGREFVIAVADGKLPTTSGAWSFLGKEDQDDVVRDYLSERLAHKDDDP